MREQVNLILKGMAMGAANVIPGVSGGTIAFITGIYERLIAALKSIDIVAIKLLLQGKSGEFAIKTDLRFLASLFFGVFVSILSLAKVLELAFENYEVLTLSFFFGLIVASIIVVARHIEQINLTSIIPFVLGVIIASGIAFLSPAHPNDNYIYLILCGVAAVCSMILPGLSGSYILLLMGNYVLVLRAVSSFDFSVILPLLLGCVLGLIFFSRLLSYLFIHFKNATITLLTGFVAGSLLIVWPWKETIFETFDGKEKAVSYVWNPPQISTQFFVAVFFLIIGFMTVIMIEKKAQKQQPGMPADKIHE